VTKPADPLARIERVRNLLAMFLVGAFVGSLIAFTFFTIPAANKDIVTYMVGQLSGMALTALGFYFVNKVGQDAIDAAKTDNSAKAFEAIKATAQASGANVEPDVTLKPGETAQAQPEGES
jgi:hypothetical protein